LAARSNPEARTGNFAKISKHMRKGPIGYNLAQHKTKVKPFLSLNRNPIPGFLKPAI
jgi:hypothetical protein